MFGRKRTSEDISRRIKDLERALIQREIDFYDLLDYLKIKKETVPAQVKYVSSKAKGKKK